MVQIQRYRSPAFNEFRRLTNSAVDPDAKPALPQPKNEETP